MATMTRKEAALRRINYAVYKIEEARQKLDEAMAALSSVKGASPQYNEILHISTLLKDLRYDVDQFSADQSTPSSVVRLDRDPKAEEEARYTIPEEQQ
jgi:hypothetical protein